MLYLYLDESGDLGFDFVNKKPSAHFTVCVLAVKGTENDRALAKAVRTVIRSRPELKNKDGNFELKGNLVPLETKKYFYKKIRQEGFRIHSATLNKTGIYSGPPPEKERIYNYIARLALEDVDLKDAAVRVIMTVDKSKSRHGIAEFNSYILSQIKARLDPLVPLDIYHVPSNTSPGLQAADLFGWGIFRKYEVKDRGWYDVFKTRVGSDKLYFFKKEEGRAVLGSRPGS